MQELDCFRKKNVDDQPLPPNNNIIEFNLGVYDIEKLEGTFRLFFSFFFLKIVLNVFL